MTSHKSLDRKWYCCMHDLTGHAGSVLPVHASEGNMNREVIEVAGQGGRGQEPKMNFHLHSTTHCRGHGRRIRLLRQVLRGSINFREDPRRAMFLTS